MAFDPATIEISHHAAERYCQRRAGPRCLTDSEEGLRMVLARCAHHNPPLFLSAKHGPGRRYSHGQFVFVTNEDSTRLITFYKRGNPGARAVDRNRCKRAARRKGYRNG